VRSRENPLSDARVDVDHLDIGILNGPPSGGKNGARPRP
jgi:hypothetical protein